MNIREALLEFHSKDQATKIADYVGDNATRFGELMKEMLGPIYRLSQRAAWPVSICVDRHPEIANPYFPKFIEQLERNDSHVSVRRNVVRLLQFVEIPKRHQGRIFDLTYSLFADVSQPVAIRVFSMTVAAALAKGNDSLMGELRLIADSHPELATAGFRARRRQIFGTR